MLDFGLSEQSIRSGFGNVHINRFRICLNPIVQRNSIQHGRFDLIESIIAESIPTELSRYMDSRSAKVSVDSRLWRGRPSLKFRGNARLDRDWCPDKWRDLIPDFHTDHIGVVSSGATGFTGQTLRRNYLDSVDTLAIAVALICENPLVNFAARDFIDINQHHFLSGRRSFRFIHGSRVGYSDSRLVFETAAVERFSLRSYEWIIKKTGNHQEMIRKVWCQMARMFGAVNGYSSIINEPLKLGWTGTDQGVQYVQYEVAPSQEAICSVQDWAEIISVHPNLFSWN